MEIVARAKMMVRFTFWRHQPASLVGPLAAGLALGQSLCVARCVALLHLVCGIVGWALFVVPGEPINHVRCGPRLSALQVERK